MQIHELKRNTANKKARQVGRGGKRGKTSGRGHKGQNARAGNKKRPEIRDVIKKLPKNRGYRTPSFEVKSNPVNLSLIEKNFEAGATVSPATLFLIGLVRRQKGVLPKVKILGTGELTKKINFEGCTMSESAKLKIEKAGGSVK